MFFLLPPAFFLFPPTDCHYYCLSLIIITITVAFGFPINCLSNWTDVSHEIVTWNGDFRISLLFWYSRNHLVSFLVFFSYLHSNCIDSRQQQVHRRWMEFLYWSFVWSGRISNSISRMQDLPRVLSNDCNSSRCWMWRKSETSWQGSLHRSRELFQYGFFYCFIILIINDKFGCHFPNSNNCKWE